MSGISEKSVARLSVYRRLLEGLAGGGDAQVYSHEIARMTGHTPALVRRDLMAVGFTGSSSRGYDAAGLAKAIGTLLDGSGDQMAALVGVGNLGRALLAYFGSRHARVEVAMAFDADPRKTGRVIHGCRCYAVEQMPVRLREAGIDVGVLAVPASRAQAAADGLVDGEVRAILNFAPVRLHVPESIFVENMDMATALEKAAFFARQRPA